MVTQAGAATRRTLLKASLAGLGGLGALGTAGCGPLTRLKLPAHAAGLDADLLNNLLAIEQHSIAAYTAAAPLLGGFGEKVASQFLSQELMHAGVLRKLVKQVGGKPHNPHTYDLGNPHGRGQLLALLHDLEREQVAAGLAAIPRLSTPYLRQTIAAMMANDAQHILVLRAQQGIRSIPGPFLTAGE